MKISNLWDNFEFPRCDTCKKDCSGHLNYDKLCSNLNYLVDYGEKNYLKNKESFAQLKKIIYDKTPTIFSFGCGLGLDFIGATEIFGKNIKYYGVEDCEWAIKKTNNYKNFIPALPQTINFETGTFLLNGDYDNLVLCFFNSLFIISENTELDKILLSSLKNKNNFYIICNFTINSNFHMPSVEKTFIEKLTKKLNSFFSFNYFEILNGEGIIVVANRKN